VCACGRARVCACAGVSVCVRVRVRNPATTVGSIMCLWVSECVCDCVCGREREHVRVLA